MTKQALPTRVCERLGLDGRDLSGSGLTVTRSQAELRRVPFEARENDDGTIHLSGYATTWDTWYDVAGGPPWGWVESIAKGAASKSLAERDDVRFLVNHDGLPLARTKAKTMTLAADDIGLLVDVPSLDPRSSVVADLASSIRRGDLDQMSFAFYVVRQEWDEDYTRRVIRELRLVDVSAVTYPANEATIIGIRGQSEESLGMPVGLARAQADALTLVG